MFKRTIHEAFKWSLKWYFGSISTSVMTFFLMEKYFEFERARSIKYGVFIFLFTFLIRVLIQYITEIDKLEDKITEKNNQLDLYNTKPKKDELIKSYNYYGETLILLKDSFSYVHKIRRQDNINNEQVIKALVSVSNKLKHIFEKRFDYTYSVSVKLLPKDNNDVSENVEVVTICRDEDSYLRRKNCNSVTHKIFENTCFNEILYNIDMVDKSFYFNNNLPVDKYYKNSSFKHYGKLPESATDSDRQRLWPLPYKSEIVVPIAPTLHSGNSRAKYFFGYLCVDCNEENAFHKKYDVGMIQGVADGLSDLLKLYKTQNN